MPFTHFTRRELVGLFGGMTGAMLLPEMALAAPQETKPAVSVSDVFNAVPIKTTKLAENLFEIEGPGGNMLVLTGADGPVLIDTGVPARMKDVAKAAAGVAHHPITTVINTHHHFDHTGGNEIFGKSKATIIAHENTRERLLTPQTVEFFNLTVPAAPVAGLPVVTFSESMTLHRSGQAIHLIHVKPAHTDNDIIVHFPNLNVIHTGDLFFNGVYPVIDFSSKGWIGGMVNGIDTILALADAQTKIVPGHGPLGDKASLTASRTMLAAVQGRIEALLKDGKSVEDIAAAKPTAEFDAQWAKGLLPPDVFVKMVAIGIIRHNA